MRCSLFVTVVFVSMASTALMAQELPRERPHAFDVSYGFYPVLQISSKINSTGGWGSPWERESIRSIGAINVGYSLDVSKRMQIGVTCSYLNIKEVYVSRSPGYSHEYRLEQITSWAMMPEVSYKWYDKKDGQVYSSLLMGVDVREESIKENARVELSETIRLKELAYQVTVLGAKVGNTRGVFVELGFGYAGYGIGGVFLKL